LIKQNLNKQKSISNIILKDDINNVSSNPSVVVNKLNEYFNSSFRIDFDVADNVNFKTYLGLSIQNSLFLMDTNEHEVFLIFNSLKNSKSAGTDNISNFLLKQNIYALTTHSLVL